MGKVQFSKLHVIFADFIVFFVFVVSAYISIRNSQPISDVSIAIITVYGAFATGGYFTLCAVRDCSLNKLEAVKIKEDGGHD